MANRPIAITEALEIFRENLVARRELMTPSPALEILIKVIARAREEYVENVRKEE